MTTMFRKTLTGAVAAVSLGAMVIASATPASAQWRGHRGGGGWGPGIAAGIIGGLALGALATRPTYRYPAPVYVDSEPSYPAAAYADPGYYPACHKEWRPIYRPDGTYVRDKLVRVCN